LLFRGAFGEKSIALRNQRTLLGKKPE